MASLAAVVAMAASAAAHLVPHNAPLAKVALRGPASADAPCRLSGRFARGQLFARLAPRGILARAKLKGLSPACEGARLSLALTVRTTIDHCDDGNCPPTDDALAAGTCVVAGGRCVITTVLASPYPASAGGETLLAGCRVRRDGTDAFVCAERAG